MDWRNSWFKFSARRMTVLSFVVVALIAGSIVFFKSDFAIKADVLTGPIITWTGNGTDTVCGGAGTANNWSCAKNWINDGVEAVPIEGDNVVFDGIATSGKKNVTINQAVKVKVLLIDLGYTGTITQGANIEITERFDQRNGIFQSNTNFAFSAKDFIINDNQIGGGEVKTMAFDSQGRLYIGGTFKSVGDRYFGSIAMFDGLAWSDLSGGVTGDVDELAIDSQDNVYVVGSFSQAGGILASGVAKWNKTSWENMDGGVTNVDSEDDVDTDPELAAASALAIDSQDRAYVGGDFANAGSLTGVNRLARWDGAQWEKIGNGLDRIATPASQNLPLRVTSILVTPNSSSSATENDIYVGGAFNICANAGCPKGDSIISYNIIKLDGFAHDWQTFGKGLYRPQSVGQTNWVNKIVQDKWVQGSEEKTIYAIGLFENAETDTDHVYEIAKLANGHWVSVDPVLVWATQLYDMLPSPPEYRPEQFVLAGTFTSGFKGGPNLRSVAKFDRYWDAKNTKDTSDDGWSNSLFGLDGGVNGGARALAYNKGRIYIGGKFSGVCKGDPGQACIETSSPNLAYYDIDSGKLNGMLAPTFNRFASGDGSVVNPYKIKDIYGLQAIKSHLDKNFELLNEIDATATVGWNSGEGFGPIGNYITRFSGSLTGGASQYPIKNIYLANSSYNGLFGGTSETANLHDFNLTNFRLAGQDFNKIGGSLAAFNHGSISNIHASGEINIKGNNPELAMTLGGLVGENLGNITNSSVNLASTSTVSQVAQIGGLVGLHENGAISDSTSSGELNIIDSAGKIGGLVGIQNLLDPVYSFSGSNLKALDKSTNISINNSHSTLGLKINMAANAFMNLNGTTRIGGLVGVSEGDISNSYALGNISCDLGNDGASCSDIGGLVGLNQYLANINNSYAANNITVTGRGDAAENLGGLVGNIVSAYDYGGRIENSHASGSIVADGFDGAVSRVGGLVGVANETNISKSYATGAITIRNLNSAGRSYTKSIGGLVGELAVSEVSESYSTGNITVTADASCSGWGGGIGGFAGILDGSPNPDQNIITKSYTISNVTSNCIKVGGFAGISSGVTDQNYSSGSVEGQSVVGGFIGLGLGSYGKTTNSFTTGAVKVNGEAAGSFAGVLDNYRISNSYASGKVTGGTKLGGLIGSYDPRTSSFLSVAWLSNPGYNEFNWDISESMNDGVFGTDRTSNIDKTEIKQLNDAALKSQASFSNWDFASVWAISEGTSYPYLRFSGVSNEAKGTLMISVDKTSVSSGGMLTYRLKFTNNTSEELSKIVITSQIPVNTTYAPNSATNFTGGSVNLNSLVWPGQTVPAGGSFEAQYQVTVN